MRLAKSGEVIYAVWWTLRL